MEPARGSFSNSQIPNRQDIVNLAPMNPVFGAPNGFGIMQIDYNNTVYQLWTWTTNVQEGLARIASNQNFATKYWNDQVASWTPNSNRFDPPADQIEGPCVFSFAPTGGQHPFSDAIWIKAYNSGPPNNNTAFITFDSNNGWQVNNNTNTSAPFDYVFRVCNTAP